MRILAAVALAAGLGFTAIAAADQPSGTVTSYATAAAPTALAAGPNGNPWFLEPGAFKVGTVAAGALAEFATSHFGLVAITAAPAGTLWVLGENGDFGGLWRLTTSGTLTPTTGLFHAPTAFATDSAGDVWVAYRFLDSVNEVKSPSYLQESDPDSRALSSGATSIAAGPDGTTMWFVEQPAGKIGSIGQSGTVQEYSLPAGVSGTLGNILLGSDGNLWVGVAGTSASWLVRITGSGSSEGATTAFSLPSGSHANVDVLASGPDGRLWMADGTPGGGDLTSMTTAGALTDYPHVLASGSSITSIVADPGGADALWMTNATATTVQRVPLAPPPSTPPPPAPAAPPVLTTTLGTATAIAIASATVSGTITEPAGSPATSASYQFEYGTGTTYGTSTAAATTTVTPAGQSVSANLTGLDPYTTYHYRLIASDCTQASCQASSADETFTTGSTLEPAQGASTGAKPVSGTILIHLPHHHGFVRLRSGELVPLGATIDARHGKVLIVSSTGSGQQASGVFSGGVFEVTQPGGGAVTVLVMQSSFNACLAAAPRLAPLARAAAQSPGAKRRKHKPSKKTVNQVFGNAHGQFATQGQYATAADQGTSWQVADRCDGTLVAVTGGQVSVTDRLHHRTFVLTAGHHAVVHHH